MQLHETTNAHGSDFYPSTAVTRMATHSRSRTAITPSFCSPNLDAIQADQLYRTEFSGPIDTVPDAEDPDTDPDGEGGSSSGGGSGSNRPDTGGGH
ncbi:hypothetical protein G7Y89_g9817 [Cudoniella acicularis]|uniref:Uncharacterized protein n=1 Tax=Cudoniella acicularis TaxID=354080 RepID=A0A8H4RDY4_9HELO|nr:hypothetical protein G7Y89_g9817 [Cudoniella acicularis]